MTGPVRWRIAPPAPSLQVAVPLAPALGAPDTGERRAAYGLLADLLAPHGLGLADLARTADHAPVLKGGTGLFVSITHCPGLVAAAVAPVPVGIDVEAVVPADRAAAELILTGAERARLAASGEPDHAFCTAFVRKEALGKAMGLGLDDPVLALDAGQETVLTDLGSFHIASIEGVAGHAAALAWRSD